MNPYVRLMRPINCVMGSIAIVLVGIIIKGYALPAHLWELVLGMLVVFFAMGGGNALNDYYDRDIDLINHPDRPIPSGKITPKSALIFGLLLFALALLLSVLINIWTFVITILAEIAMVIYEAKLKNKGFVGNVTISILVGLIFVFGGAIFNDVQRISIFALMAFSANLGREIVKDIEDVEGDINRQTLPKKIGTRNAGFIATIFFLLAVILSPLPYLFLGFSLYYFIAVLLSDAIFIYVAIIHFKSPSKGQKGAKMAMIFGLLSYLIGGLT